MDERYTNLMFDLADGHDIYDGERTVSVAEASEQLRNYCLGELGLTEKATPRQIKRALESDNGKQFFQIIEEILDKKIDTGWHENEFFNEFVEIRNLADGDNNEFWTDDDIILEVAKVSGDHHDLTMQRLTEGESYHVGLSDYAVKVGSPLRLFLTGRKNWADFIKAVAEAYAEEVQNEVYAEVMAVGDAVPAQFHKTIAITAENKSIVDNLIDDVAMVNGNVPVILMGTKTALRNFNNLSEVNWRPEYLKEQVAKTGILGDYESTAMVEIPQRFKRNDLSQKLVSTSKILVLPLVSDNKFVKFVDGGETTLEVSEAGKTRDDMQSYEAQRRMGIGTRLTRYFGVIDITA